MNEAAAYFDTLSEKQIRQRQDLCNRQIEVAHAQKNDRAIANLRRMEQDLTDAMLRRIDVRPSKSKEDA